MKCPICRKPALPEHKPFCSPRCAEVDLGRWLTDEYRLPAPETPEEECEM
ncbi:DNA gyrase inhibitor YacG [Acidocella sp.]|nr:DNA gyrase inhibitor YacG [Acidocella sp.]